LLVLFCDALHLCMPESQNTIAHKHNAHLCIVFVYMPNPQTKPRPVGGWCEVCGRGAYAMVVRAHNYTNK